ncbi:hypothetical protein PPL_09666 [Heterostelium album PN500]|uniref:Uncharacterized protein n=1 Tax=Heterostelium pallidum (strain ATCC 26659 / Pp 5 / PN500) TaxID=670386 RepID=D3BNG3_HETP5|nr:hypothetical protein PPL_09666 [Heterostelium album PN500]EFA76914.1 hypothetical protein PPL_09666 [Heterostelium album PN500]|eukprot:XP_020429046.1 hypothetical protein PPL_09666 [Heterostelium album PN500]
MDTPIDAQQTDQENPIDIEVNDISNISSSDLEESATSSIIEEIKNDDSNIPSFKDDEEMELYMDPSFVGTIASYSTGWDLQDESSKNQPEKD